MLYDIFFWHIGIYWETIILKKVDMMVHVFFFWHYVDNILIFYTYFETTNTFWAIIDEFNTVKKTWLVISGLYQQHRENPFMIQSLRAH